MNQPPVEVIQADLDMAVRAIPAAVIFAEAEDHVADLRNKAAALFAEYRHRLSTRPSPLPISSVSDQAREPTVEDRTIYEELCHQGFAVDDAWSSAFGISEALERARALSSARPISEDPRDDISHPDHDAVCGWCGELHPTAEEIWNATPHGPDCPMGLPEHQLDGDDHCVCDRPLRAITRALSSTSSPTAFQDRVAPWMLECFGAEIARDKIERNHRFLEEALKLVQSLGCTRSEAHQLVDYTFARAEGEPVQEVGGVMVTLAALCLASDMDMHRCGEAELARISAPATIKKIRAKQAAKPKHSPLPAASPTAEPVAHAENVSMTQWPAGSTFAEDDLTAGGLHAEKGSPTEEVIEAAVAALHPAWFATDFNHREAQKAIRAALRDLKPPEGEK